jgi:hypothetical protein
MYLLLEGLRASEKCPRKEKCDCYLGSIRNLGSVGSTRAPEAAAACAVVTPSSGDAGPDLLKTKNVIAPVNKATALAISKGLKWLLLCMETSVVLLQSSLAPFSSCSELVSKFEARET